MDVFNQFSDKKPQQQQQQKESKPHPSFIANANKQHNEIMQVLKALFQRQGAIKDDTNEILRRLNGFNKTGLRSQIPYMTPKTLYTLYKKRGWSVEEIMNVSGYSQEDVIKKIKSYNDNNVEV